MFGTYRFILALLVVMQHFKLPFPGPVGNYAVAAFYVLSGYLMTLVLNEKYQGIQGTAHFLVNRALRIYPSYLVVALFTLFFVYFEPNIAWKFYKSIIMPQTVGDWLTNLTIMGLWKTNHIILVPQGWTLFVELFYYVVMTLLSRNRVVTAGWFIASLVWTGTALYIGMSFEDRHATITAASLHFSTGAMIYHYGQKVGRWLWTGPALAYGAIILTAKPPHGGAPYYLSILAAALLIMTLRDKRSKRWDSFLGDLSYPMYLSHFAVGILISKLFFGHAALRSYPYFLIYLFYIIVFSYILHRYVEKPINGIRERVKIGDRRIRSAELLPVGRSDARTV